MAKEHIPQAQGHIVVNSPYYLRVICEICGKTYFTSVENPRQRRVNLYKLVRLWRDRHFFMQNKASLQTTKMSTSLYEQKNCEEKPRGALRKNKANLKQRTEVGKQKTEAK